MHINLDDVLDLNFINNLNSLVYLSNDDLLDLSLTMSVAVIAENKHFDFDLVKNGKSILVDKSNVVEYVELLKKYYTFEMHNTPQYLNLLAFSQGFKVIFGENIIMNTNVAKQCYNTLTSFNKYPNIDPEDYDSLFISKVSSLEFLIRYLRERDTETFRKFLVFTTSQNYVSHKISVYSTQNTKNIGYPSSSTCTRELFLPDLPSYELFAERMDYAINTSGFQNG